MTVRKADLQRDIKSLISYGVGCMFGHYSLDVDGLAYACGEWDSSKYTTYPADKDNIIPICDDEYFDDDMVGRFVKFIETVYGSGTMIKVDELASTLQVCLDSGGKRVLIPSTSFVDFTTVPPDLMSAFQLIPYQSAEDAVFKALGVE